MDNIGQRQIKCMHLSVYAVSTVNKFLVYMGPGFQWDIFIL